VARGVGRRHDDAAPEIDQQTTHETRQAAARAKEKYRGCICQFTCQSGLALCVRHMYLQWNEFDNVVPKDMEIALYCID
jgi:hypothetical protein